MRLSRQPVFVLSNGMEGKALNASNSDPKKMFAKFRADLRTIFACIVLTSRLIAPVSKIKWYLPELQLVVLASFWRHLHESMISPRHLVLAGHRRLRSRARRTGSSKRVLLCLKRSNWDLAQAASECAWQKALFNRPKRTERHSQNP